MSRCFHRPPRPAMYGMMIAVVACACVLSLHTRTGAIMAIHGPRAASGGWTAALEKQLAYCQSLAPHPATKSAAKVYQFRLRLLQGAWRWRRWLKTLPATKRAELTRWAQAPAMAALAQQAFSPSRRDRAAVAAMLAKVPGTAGAAILETLLVDPSRYVRLSAMNALWPQKPSAGETAQLFWLAVDVWENVPYRFHRASRTWSAVSPDSPGTPMMVRYHGKRMLVMAMPRTYFFPDTDQRRAADMLIHWNNPILAVLLVQPLEAYQKPAVADGIILPAAALPAMVDSQANYLRIFQKCRPLATAPYLLRLIDKPDRRAGVWLNPQGRTYYKSAHTLPLCLLSIDAGMNPIHLGLVKIGCTAASYSPPEICAIGHHDQLKAIRMIQAWCRQHHIEPAKDALAPPQITAFGPDTTLRHPAISLAKLEYALIGWVRWANALPAGPRRAMLAWGAKPANIQQAALAFVPETLAQCDAARLLGSSQNPSARRVLARLILSPRQAVALTAMNVLGTRSLSG